MERNLSEEKSKNNDETDKTRQLLDKLIKQDIKVKEAVNNARGSLTGWQVHEIALRNSNEKLKMELKSLQMENKNMEEQIAMKVESHLKLNDEFKEYEERNREEDEKFWRLFNAEIDKYRNLFTNAEKEYNTDALKRDIEHYGKESDDVTVEIEKIDDEMEELTDNFGLIELTTNKKADCLEELQQFHRILLENDKLLSLQIQSREIKFQQLKSKIRHLRREMEILSKK